MAGKPMVVILGVLLGASSAVPAQEAGPEQSPVPDGVTTDPKAMKELQSFESMLAIPSVVNQHPDLRYRDLAMAAYKNGDKERALRMFMRASSYADKPSQAAVANMYWEGVGTPVDRPRAYAWMDLAASRGYNRFIAQREYFWGQLTEAERAQALRVGQDIYAEYDDKVSLHRLQMELEFVRRNVTGSRVGFVGPGKVYGAGVTSAYNPNATSWMDLTELYRPSVWNVDNYAKMKDLQWKVQVESRPTVEVGGLQNVKPSEPSSGK
ncbi:tetratricopeptide repeat protein [Dyella amyloliquefaciens]|uniref:tetratricopeptide repeat protein n=1 Tax=Dyella amyloliquefaciens TaxID=1770545 RepID=UPI00102E7696|nr:sel1 repeat family protein [Dyella amyloliquefaciens]